MAPSMFFPHNSIFSSYFYSSSVTSYSLSMYYDQDGVEAEVVISQIHQEGVSIQGALAEEMVKMVVIGSTANRKETVSIDRILAKREEIQGIIKHQEMGRTLLSPEPTEITSARESNFGSTYFN